MYFVYILACRQTGRSYVGHTADLIDRFRRHCSGSTRTTREQLREPVVVHWESLPTRSEAMRRERYYKHGAGHRLRQQLVTAGLNLYAAES